MICLTKSFRQYQVAFWSDSSDAQLLSHVRWSCQSEHPTPSHLPTSLRIYLCILHTPVHIVTMSDGGDDGTIPPVLQTPEAGARLPVELQKEGSAKLAPVPRIFRTKKGQILALISNSQDVRLSKIVGVHYLHE